MLRILAITILAVASIQAADLAARLDAILAEVPAGGLASVAVADCATGAVLYRHHADRPLKLASTTKLLITAAALRGLGADYRFRTRLVALGPISDGSLPGLGVIGGGDPTFDEHFNDDRDPARVFADWAARLKAAGVRRIQGDLVIDARLFSGPIRPDTYPKDAENIQRWYSAPASAFAWADNCIEVRALPGRAGAPCRIEMRPHSPRIQIDNRTSTGAGRIIIGRAKAANTVTVSGSTATATDWFPLAIAEDPDLLAGDEMKHQLGLAGIAVTGGVRLDAVDPDAGRTLIDHRSDLGPALRLMNQRSQNFYGEQILRLIGVAGGGRGSLADGLSAAQASLGKLVGKDSGPITLLDGCGLSYGNSASAGTMVRLLTVMAPDKAFVESLKEEKKYDLSGAHGRVKTGTLAVAVCLAGYVEAEGRRHAFALLFNRGDSARWSWATGLRDRCYAAIAANVAR